MIAVVARALGPDLLQKVAFVGGCTTGLLLTDAFSKQQVRHTDDVAVLGFTNRWYAQALQSAQPFALPDGQVIRLLTPAFFVATKSGPRGLLSGWVF
jgi:hypothetical protein